MSKIKISFGIFFMVLNSLLLFGQSTIYNINDFGAQAGVDLLQTNTIQAAADKCRDNGGGTINIPPGRFRTGTIRLYSNTVLNLEAGAVLLGPDTLDGYTRIAIPHSMRRFIQKNFCNFNFLL